MIDPGSVSEMSLLQKSCVVACDLQSFMVLFLKDVFALVLLVGISGMESKTTEANLHENQFATKSLGVIAGEKNLVPPGMWSMYGGALPEFTTCVAFRCTTEEEGQATGVATTKTCWPL